MTVKGLISALTQQEDLNFLLTNRVPRAALTRFMGWFSKIEKPLVRDLSIACWRLFSDLDLSEARKSRIQEPARLLHPRAQARACVRPTPTRTIVVSPCDAIIGAFGAIADTELFQVKGAPYSLLDLHRRSRAGGGAPQRPVHHLAADLQHVSPLSRARGLPDRAGRFHQRRYLERQSDRAEADREAVLQERARGDPDPPRHRRGADAGAGRGHSGGQHPAAFSRSSAQCRHAAGRSCFPATSTCARARNSAGSSTARPSSCWRRKISSSATISWRSRADPRRPAVAAKARLNAGSADCRGKWLVNLDFAAALH